jgi:hypothetical protein
MIATGIITAARPRPTLMRSLESFRAAKFGRAEIFADCPLPDGIPLPDIGVHVNGRVLGNLRNWTRALQWLYTHTRADWLMICEDDINWVPDCAPKLDNELAHMVQTPAYDVVGALSLYLPVRMSKHIEQASGRLPAGWHFDGLQYGRKTWGAQCLLFSRHQAEALLFDAQFLDFLSDQRWQKNIDAIVGKVINDQTKVIAYRVPCLVNHEWGEGNSSLGYADDRPQLRTNYFTGRA